MAIEQCFHPLIVTDKNQRLAVSGRGLKQNIEKGLTGTFVKRRCRFIRNQQFGGPDKSARRSDTLLLTDTQIGDAPAVQITFGNPHMDQQTTGLRLGIAALLGGAGVATF